MGPHVLGLKSQPMQSQKGGVLGGRHAIHYRPSLLSRTLVGTAMTGLDADSLQGQMLGAVYPITMARRPNLAHSMSS